MARRHWNTVPLSAWGIVVDVVDLVVSTTALGSLLSVVSTATLHDWGSVVSATALSVIATAALLRSSACRGVVAASSHCHLERDCWNEMHAEINVGLGWARQMVGDGPQEKGFVADEDERWRWEKRKIDKGDKELDQTGKG